MLAVCLKPESTSYILKKTIYFSGILNYLLSQVFAFNKSTNLL